MERAIKQLEQVARDLGVAPAQVKKHEHELREFARRWQAEQEKRKLESPILVNVLESL